MSDLKGKSTAPPRTDLTDSRDNRHIHRKTYRQRLPPTEFRTQVLDEGGQPGLNFSLGALVHALILSTMRRCERFRLVCFQCQCLCINLPQVVEFLYRDPVVCKEKNISLTSLFSTVIFGAPGGLHEILLGILGILPH